MDEELYNKLKRLVAPPTKLELVYEFCAYITSAATLVFISYLMSLAFAFILVSSWDYLLAVKILAAAVIFFNVIEWLTLRRLRRIRHDEEKDD